AGGGQPQRPDQPLQPGLVGEELGQLGLQLGVAGHPLARLRGPAGVVRLQVRADGPPQPLLPLVDRLRVAPHRPPLPPPTAQEGPSSIPRSALTPRWSTPPTAAVLRPMTGPISATAGPCRCLSSTACRWSSGSRASASARPSSCSSRAAPRPGDGWL